MKWSTSFALVSASVLLPAVAGAHIHLSSPLSRTDILTGDQKAEHCGVAGYVRADHPERVTTFTPGATITLTWAETINHPGWFRISFQPNGEIFEIPKAGNGPPSGYPSEDLTGQTDAASGSIILADRIPDGTLTKTVTLPNVECANCTLQFIQVMTDAPPYTTDAASNDVYFNCADIVLSAAAPDAGTTDAPPTGPDAGTNPQSPGSVDGGCATTSGASGLVMLGIVGALVRRRRRS